MMVLPDVEAEEKKSYTDINGIYYSNRLRYDIRNTRVMCVRVSKQ